MSKSLRLALLILACDGLLLPGSGCRRDQDDGRADHQADQAGRKQAQLLVFPEGLRVEDESINRFIEQAMTGCAGGDYDEFRLLWSVREDPLSREEYEEGWHAVREIRVRALEKVMLALGGEGSRSEGDTAYGILVDVDLNPSLRAGRREPNREVVLAVVREQDEWRLARAPKAMRVWLIDRVRGEDSGSERPAGEPESPQRPGGPG